MMVRNPMSFSLTLCSASLLVLLMLSSISGVSAGGKFGRRNESGCSCSRGSIRASRRGRVFRTKRAACRNAARRCFRKRCSGLHFGHEKKKNKFYGCVGFPRCYAAKRWVIRLRLRRKGGRGFRRVFRCKVLCGGSKAKKCRAPGGRDDPHMRGFDGSRFDFHGEPGRHYAVFGREGGDFLSATMRAATATEEATNTASAAAGETKIVPTFFDAFGITSKGGVQVRVGLVERKGKNAAGSWRPTVSVNGAPMAAADAHAEGDVAVTVGKWKVVMVKTGENEFEFSPARLFSAADRHLNLGIKRLESAREASERFVGVLGWTLNRKLGLKTARGLDLAAESVRNSNNKDASAAVNLEKELRARFELQSLFPKKKDTEGDKLAGVVRIARPLTVAGEVTAADVASIVA